MPRVTFVASGAFSGAGGAGGAGAAQPARSVVVARGASLFRAVLRARMPLARSCRGVGVCGLCNLQVRGEPGALSPPPELERQLAARVPLGAGQRFACLARVLGDVTVSASYW